MAHMHTTSAIEYFRIVHYISLWFFCKHKISYCIGSFFLVAVDPMGHLEITSTALQIIKDPSSVAVDPMGHLTPPLDPLGPCRPAP